MQALAQIIVNPTAPHTARVIAANTMLRNARTGIERDLPATRLAELERLIAEKSKAEWACAPGSGPGSTA